MSEQSSPSGQRPEQPTPWRKLHLWQIQPLRDVLVVLLIVALFLLGQALSLVTVPLLLAILLAYLFEPAIVWATRRTKLSRQTIAASILVLIGVLVIVPATVATIFGISQAISTVSNVRTDIDQVIRAIEDPTDQNAVDDVPKHWKWIVNQIQSEIDAHRQRNAPPPSNDPAAQESNTETASAEPVPLDPEQVSLTTRALRYLRDNADAITLQLFQTGRDALSATIRFAVGMGKIAFGAFLTAFFFYFISSGWGKVIQFGESLIPEQNADRIKHLIIQFDRVVAGFIRGRLTIAFIQSIMFALLYWMIGTPAPLLFGIGIGILAIVPYLATIGVPIAMIAMWLDPADGFRGAWWWILIMPTVVYNLGQAVDDYFLTPKIQGKSTNLDVPTILFASLAGGILFGFYGLLIAIPVAACIKIALRELFWPRFKAWAEGREADFLPIENK